MTAKRNMSVLMVIGALFLISARPYAMAGNSDRDLSGLIAEFRMLVQESRSSGKDVSAAVELDRRSKEAFMSRQYKKARRFLEEAISLLQSEDIKDLSTVNGSILNDGSEMSVGGYGDSPFGIHDPAILARPLDGGNKPRGADEIRDIAAAGAKWVRYAGITGIVWDLIERKKGRYDWSKTDFIYGETHKNNVRMIVNVLPFNRLDKGIPAERQSTREERGTLPEDMGWYLGFLKKAVERYDGDGIDDAPGSPVVDVWQIGNELDTPGSWNETPEKYVYLLGESYNAIKDANPQAKVAIAGMATTVWGFPLYSKILHSLAANSKNSPQRYFDIFDFHWSGQFQGTYKQQPPDGDRLDVFLSKLKKELNQIGHGDVSIWITEMSDYSGKPKPGRFGRKEFRYHSEKDQAVSMFKMYLYALVHGTEKAFWVTLTEWHGFGFGGPEDAGGYFDTVGLIHNPLNHGKSHKKLAYYTYKKMSSVLENADWNNVRILQEKNGTYMYQLKKEGKSIWVVWSDNSGKKQVKISGVEASRIRTTYVVPREMTGENVQDYNSAFETKYWDVSNKEVSFDIEFVPMIIEET